MPGKPKFQEAEEVLCYHGPLLYEAKCIGVKTEEGKVLYRIHYKGWNKNWDEWVQETRIVKNNEAGYQKQKELLKNHGALKKKTKAAKKLEKDIAKQQKTKEKQSKETPKEKEKAKDSKETVKRPVGRPSTPQPNTGDKRKDRGDPRDKARGAEDRDKSVSASSSAQTVDSSQEPKRKRARLDPTIETEDTYLSKIEVKIKIPDDLKPVLVDDWDIITRQKMIVSLPCKMTVDDIIEEYVKSKTSKSSSVNKDALIETMAGCKDYFNVMLGTQLLYKFERPQYGEIKTESPDKPMSSIYGAVHFLRLFVRLGAMLAYTSLDERTVHILLNHVHDFLKYLSKNAANYFKISNYEVAPPDYHRKAI